MNFTDDDLRKLKNREGYWRDDYEMRKANPQVSASWGWVDGMKIQALLSRLEAAEALIHVIGGYAKEFKEYGAWLKEAGK